MTYELQSLLPTKEIGSQKWYLVTEPIEVFVLTKKSTSHQSTPVVISKTCEITHQSNVEIIYNTKLYSKKQESSSHGTANAEATILQRDEIDCNIFLSKAYLTSVKKEEIRFRQTTPAQNTCLLASGLEIGDKKLLALSCYPPFDFPKIDKERDPPKEVIVAVNHQIRSPK